MIAVVADGIIGIRHEFPTKTGTDETQQLLFALVRIASKTPCAPLKFDIGSPENQPRKKVIPSLGYALLNPNMDTQNCLNPPPSRKQYRMVLATWGIYLC